MKTVTLKQKEDRRILRGHPWVFSNELERSAAVFEPGEIVDVLDFSGRFIGRGYINPRSLIAVRILTGSRRKSTANSLEGGSPPLVPSEVISDSANRFARCSAKATAFPA